jgi:hypothetical protein
MATPEVIYHHEYVSGVVIAIEFSLMSVSVANRGLSRQQLRLSVWDGGEQLHETPDELVEPGSVWGGPHPQEGDVISATGRTWVRIRTTSLDLVPSLEAFEGVVSDADDVVGFQPSVYQGPGDFAVFDLHPPPPIPRPPVGPAIGA